jgi:hypothetical protein
MIITTRIPSIARARCRRAWSAAIAFAKVEAIPVMLLPTQPAEE